MNRGEDGLQLSGRRSVGESIAAAAAVAAAAAAAAMPASIEFGNLLGKDRYI